jgi:hypothetical protein
MLGCKGADKTGVGKESGLIVLMKVYALEFHVF